MELVLEGLHRHSGEQARYSRWSTLRRQLHALLEDNEAHDWLSSGPNNPPGRQQRLDMFEKVFAHLLVMLDGDTDRALDQLESIGQRYGLFDDS